MLGILLISIFAIYLVFLYPIFTPSDKKVDEEKSDKYNAQMKKLWNIAQTSMREKKTMHAEAALLTILKFDEKNAAAYNRLGILYAKEQNYDEAIECFEIAQSLDNNASSLHNVGLIYLETGAYEKAAMAFEQALELEGDMPARYIALAKAQEKLGHRKAAIEALESAYDLDSSVNTLRQILSIYEDAEDQENIAIITARIEQQLEIDAAKRAENNKAKERAARQKARKDAREAKRVAKREAKVMYPKTKKAEIERAKKKALTRSMPKTMSGSMTKANVATKGTPTVPAASVARSNTSVNKTVASITRPSIQAARPTVVASRPATTSTVKPAPKPVIKPAQKKISISD